MYVPVRPTPALITVGHEDDISVSISSSMNARDYILSILVVLRYWELNSQTL